jgi:histidine ammonia-lyase
LALDPTTILIGARPLTIEEVGALAQGEAKAALDPDPVLRARIEAGSRFVEESLAQGREIYGVTTGFGASVEHSISVAVAEAMPHNLLRYHGCGTGALLSEEESAAVLAIRLASLSRGYSAVRPALIERLLALLNARVLPAIPEEGSVGASGDLTPLSYVAALLIGEREALVEGRPVAAREALATLGLSPLSLRPKESLAVMNGTSVMSALCALGFSRAERLARLGAAASAMASDVLLGSPDHFDDRIFELKPHPGQRLAASWIRARVGGRERPPARVQDRYSIRCAPHVLGVLVDLLPFARRLIEAEIHGVNDNPIIDPGAEGEAGRVLHGGNFYGGHVCFAADSLKSAVAGVAELMERQLVLLNHPSTSYGLPANLVGREGEDRFTHHGFKAMEISASALTAEALKLTMPAASFSRSTESHNQDKVSMGAIAARELRRVLDLSETVAAIHLLALAQAVDLRGPEGCHVASQKMWAAVREVAAKHEVDRRMDHDIAALLERIRSDALPLPEPPPEGGEGWR